MRLLAFDSLTPVPWRNGGGVTREIASREDASGLLWRLSLAEVDREGPFSAFPGLARLLTVVQGGGMVLDTPSGPLPARPFEPLPFDGGLAVTGRLPNGPVRDLNVIWRPSALRAAVEVRRGPFAGRIAAEPGGLVALHAPLGGVRLDGEALPPGATALGADGTVETDPSAVLLEIRIAPAP
jgi:environmental stress-induced protein Ves